MAVHQRRRNSSPTRATEVTRPRTTTKTVDLSTGFMGVTLGTEEWFDGVVIEKVEHEDKAYAAGLRVGDVILSINETPVSDHTVAVELIESAVNAKSALKVIHYSAANAQSQREQAKLKYNAAPSTSFKVAVGLGVALVTVLVLCVIAYVKHVQSAYGESAGGMDDLLMWNQTDLGLDFTTKEMEELSQLSRSVGELTLGAAGSDVSVASA